MQTGRMGEVGREQDGVLPYRLEERAELALVRKY
jgi:hypothetical protein